MIYYFKRISDEIQIDMKKIMRDMRVIYLLKLLHIH